MGGEIEWTEGDPLSSAEKRSEAELREDEESRLRRLGAQTCVAAKSCTLRKLSGFFGKP
jgi:hypothetical protein